MRSGYVFAILYAVASLTGCASTGSQVSGDSGEAMLVTGAMLQAMNDAGQLSSTRYPLTALSVKNLDNGRVYDLPLNSGHGLVTLPAGTYCMNSVSPENYATLEYCGKPYFRLSPDKITFTGYFVFALNRPTHTYKLLASFLSQQSLADELTQDEKHELENFSDKHHDNSN